MNPWAPLEKGEGEARRPSTGRIAGPALRGLVLLGGCLLLGGTMLTGLTAVGIAGTYRWWSNLQVSLARLQMDNVAKGLEVYKVDFGEYPARLEDAVAWLPHQEIPLDPWFAPFVYTRVSPTAYTLASLGRDGKPGGTGYDADLSSADEWGPRPTGPAR